MKGDRTMKLKWFLLFVAAALLIAMSVASEGGMWAEDPWCWVWFKGPQVQWIPLVVGP